MAHYGDVFNHGRIDRKTDGEKEDTKRLVDPHSRKSEAVDERRQDSPRCAPREELTELRPDQIHCLE